LGPRAAPVALLGWVYQYIIMCIYIYIWFYMILYDIQKKNGENMSSSYSRSPKNHQILCKCSLKLMKMEEKSRCQWSYATSTRNCRCLDIVSETQTPCLTLKETISGIFKLLSCALIKFKESEFGDRNNE
jgi:hypothetical protein